MQSMATRSDQCQENRVTFQDSLMRFHHTSFTVSNVAATERFFIENFGMIRLGGGRYDYDYIRRTIGFEDGVLLISVLGFPGNDADVLELIEYVQPHGEPVDTATNRPGAAHLCFETQDIHADYTRLKVGGVAFKSTPNEVQAGINRGAWSVYFNGPDGIALELFQPPQK